MKMIQLICAAVIAVSAVQIYMGTMEVSTGMIALYLGIDAIAIAIRASEKPS